MSKIVFSFQCSAFSVQLFVTLRETNPAGLRVKCPLFDICILH